MGGVGHQRLERLWSESAVVQTTRGTVYYSSGTVPKDVTPTITRLTPQEVWDRVQSAEGYESGHSYSGNFAVKPGFQTFGTAKVDAKVLDMAGTIVATIEYGDDSEWNPLRDRTDVRCDWREGWGRYCSEGTTTEQQEATLPDGSKVPVTVKVKCPQCGGTGRRPFTDEEAANEVERQRLVKEAISAFGLPALRRAGEQYGDKWGDAVALVGADHVWFGGVCSS